MTLLRIKKQGCEVIVLDTALIHGYEVRYCEDIEEYELIVYLGICYTVIETGSMDKCHALLNKINSALNYQFIDL